MMNNNKNEKFLNLQTSRMLANKRGFQFSFAWMFAIIVGVVIIFLAIFAATRFVETEREIQDTEIGKEIGILLSPIETNLEDARKAVIVMPFESRLGNGCRAEGNFGSQDISIASKSGVGREWQRQGVPSSFHNKYVFSSNTVEGKSFRVMAKPFEFPYKAGSLMYIWSDKDKYCFVTPPRYVEEEIEDLGLGINVNLRKEDCAEDEIQVCFAGSGCDIDVSLDFDNDKSGSVKRKFVDSVYFEGEALLYGAIFADPGIYECQVRRLMGRVSELSLLYLEKSEFLTPKGCGSGSLQPLLINYAQKTMNVNNSINLRDISQDAQELRRKNELLSCELF